MSTQEITICIPVFNAAATLFKCLQILGSQEFDHMPTVLLYDNGSRDGTIELIQAWINRHTFPNMAFVLKQFPQINGGKTQNIPYMRTNLARDVKTEFIFWLDTDVLLMHPRTIKILLTQMKEDPTIGLLGVRYTPKADHVQMGASIMRADVAKQIQWKFNEFCECKSAITDLVSMGLRAEIHPDLMASHHHFL